MKLQGWLPFQVVSDGELIGTMLPYYGVSKVSPMLTKHDVALAKTIAEGVAKRGHDGVLPELKLSKARQAKCKIGQA